MRAENVFIFLFFVIIVMLMINEKRSESDDNKEKYKMTWRKKLNRRSCWGVIVSLLISSFPCMESEKVSAEESLVIDEWKYSVNVDETVTIDKYTGDEAIVRIPEEIDGMKVTIIGNSAFESNQSLDEIVFIGEGYFSYFP